MDKNLRLNRIFRILAGIYLLYLSTSLWRAIDTSGNKIVGIVFIIIFATIGVIFITLSTRDLIRMKKERTDETEDIADEPIDEILEEKDDTEDLNSDSSESYDDAEVTSDDELNHENEITDDGVDDSSDINTIDNIKDHTQD